MEKNLKKEYITESLCYIPKHCKSTALQKKIEIELPLIAHSVLLNKKGNFQSYIYSIIPKCQPTNTKTPNQPKGPNYVFLCLSIKEIQKDIQQVVNVDNLRRIRMEGSGKRFLTF